MASSSIEVEVTPPAEIIDVETGEQLAMRATATMTVVADSKTTTETLSSNDLVETVLEQNEGETQRLLRLSAADPKRQDDVQFSIEGIASPGTFKTGERELRVVFFNAPVGVDLLSDQGECTVVFDRVETSDVAGNVTCANIESPAGKVQLSATFKAETVEP